MPIDPIAAAREPHPDPQVLTGSEDKSIGEHKPDYTPHPEKSIQLSSEREDIIRRICNLYSGSASEEDMLVYAEKAVYDDPLSYCDTRYKIAGQWYGIPIITSKSRTLATEVVKSSAEEVVFKLRQEYTPRLMPAMTVDSLVSLGLIQEDGREKVVYHKDMWNEKDYSHQGMGFFFKKLNGDWLTIITQPPKNL